MGVESEFRQAGEPGGIGNVENLSNAGSGLAIPGVEDLFEIGRGGFGVVYRATESDLGREVAVKVLSGELDERVRSRFTRECRAMGALSGHPHIITIYRNGSSSTGSLYLLMEYLRGGSLADRLQEDGALPWSEVLAIGVALAGAIESAHRAGVLHRDVKPGNVMIDDMGRAKLGDFGIARLDGGPETKSSVITASVAHAPPEVIAGERPDERSDIYSLASTLFELTSGAAAFVRPTDESMIPMFARIVNSSVPDIRSDGVPDEMASILERAMAKDRNDRYSTAAEFGTALAQAQTELGLSESQLWITGEPADSRATAASTQRVEPPVSSPPPPTPAAPPSESNPAQVQSEPAPAPAPAQATPEQPPTPPPPATPQQASSPAPPSPTPAPVVPNSAATPVGKSKSPVRAIVAAVLVGSSLLVALVVAGLLLTNGDTSTTVNDTTTTTTEVERETEDTTTTTDAPEPPPDRPIVVAERPDFLASLPALPANEQPYTDLRTVIEETTAFSFSVPVEWPEDLSTRGQIITSIDNGRALTEELVSGVIVNGFASPGVFDGELLLDLLLEETNDPSDPCTELLRDTDFSFTARQNVELDGVLHSQRCESSEGLSLTALVATPDRAGIFAFGFQLACLLYTSPSPRDS